MSAKNNGIYNNRISIEDAEMLSTFLFFGALGVKLASDNGFSIEYEGCEYTFAPSLVDMMLEWSTRFAEWPVIK